MTDPLGAAVMTACADMAEWEAHMSGALRRSSTHRVTARRWRWAFRATAAVTLAVLALYIVALAVRYPVGYGWYTAVPILGFAATEYAAWRERRHLRASTAASDEVTRLLDALPGAPR
jgi:hypothetical protein